MEQNLGQLLKRVEELDPELAEELSKVILRGNYLRPHPMDEALVRKSSMEVDLGSTGYGPEYCTLDLKLVISQESIGDWIQYFKGMKNGPK